MADYILPREDHDGGCLTVIAWIVGILFIVAVLVTIFHSVRDRERLITCQRAEATLMEAEGLLEHPSGHFILMNPAYIKSKSEFRRLNCEEILNDY